MVRRSAFDVVQADGKAIAVASLTVARDGALYVGTYDDGLYRLAGTAVEHWGAADGLPDGWITDLLEDAHGALWIASAPGGVSRRVGARIERFDRTLGLPSDSARALVEDRERSVWIGTNGGLARLKDLKFVTLTRRHGLPEDHVRTVLEARDGTLWIGTYGGGLVRLRDGALRVFGVPDGWTDAYIRTLAESADGTLWVGTQTGLNRVVGDTLESMTSRDGLVGAKVEAIAELADGTLLVNTEPGGLQARAPGAQFAPYIADAVELLRTTRAIRQTRDGHVWLGTGEHGLVEVHEGRVLHTFGEADGLPDEAVFALHDDADGALWIGTHKGLARLREGRVARVEPRHGLPETTVFQILDDGRGTLWLTSHRGLFALRRADAEAVLEGRRATLAVRVFDRDDGLGADVCSGGTQPAATRLADGRLAIPTVGGLTLVDPADLHENRVPPPTHLTHVLVDGHALPLGRDAAPPWSSQRFEFRFDGLSLLVPEAVGFRYRLDGFDADWIDGGASRYAQYTTLPPGDYRFRVQARNNDGVWSNDAAQFAFVLAAPPWLRGWAIAIYVVVAALAVLALVRLRERRLVARNLELERSVAARTAELSDTNRRLLDASQQLASANRRLEALAVTDGLTGVANRRRLDAVLEDEWARAQRTQRPLAFLLLDIDHFKAFNDAYGHPEGDECLRTVARTLRDATRKTDIPARYGGEEFAVVCPDTTREQALVLAGHVLEAVRALRLPHAASPVAPHVTASIGVACALPGACPDVEALVAAADAALYEAKRTGRDRAIAARDGAQAASAK